MAGAGKKRVWFVGVVGVVAVAAAGVMVLVDGDDSPDVAAGGDGYLIGGTLPEGWDVMLAADGETMAELAADDDDPASERAGEIVAYGDGDQDDPWEGPVLALRRYDEGSPPGPETSVPSEEVSAGGEAFTVFEDGADEDVLTARAADETLVVVGYGLARDDVLASLDHLDPEPEIGSDGLPDGYEEIARGPISATEPVPEALGGSGAVTLGFWRETVYAPSADVTLTQHPAGSDDAVGLIHLADLGESRVDTTTELTEVRGQEAHVLRQHDPDEVAGGPDTVESFQWFEPSLGQLVTLTATDVDQAILEQVIDGLRAGSEAEVDRLLASDYPALEPEPACASGPATASVEGSVSASGSSGGEGAPPPTVGPPPEGSVVLADEEGDDLAWQLSFLGEGEGCGSLHLETARPSGGDATSVQIYGSLTEPRTRIPELWTFEPTVGVFGFVAEGVADVRVRHSHGETYELELFAIDSVEAQAFVGFVPPEEEVYELVALDERGEVLDEWVSDGW